MVGRPVAAEGRHDAKGDADDGGEEHGVEREFRRGGDELSEIVRDGAVSQRRLPEVAVQTAAVAVMSGTAPPPSLTDLIPRISPRPLLLIYAGHGGGGEELQPDYYRAASAPKTLWEIPEAGHVGGFDARPAEYERRVVRFFDHALLSE